MHSLYVLKMKIFKLHPITSSYSGWKYSTISEDVIIRAENEKEARRIAFITFSKMAPVQAGSPNATCPWNHAEFVECTELEDSPCPKEGEQEILHPAKYNYEFKRSEA